MEKIRRATHTGSWYTDNPNKLAEELDEWLRSLMNGLEALVCLNLQMYEPGFVPVNEELKATGKFELMVQVDEAEHSMEMHLPYLARVFHGYSVKVVPILVGAVNAETEAIYGQQLSSYVDDPANFFCVLRLLSLGLPHGAIHKSIEALDKMGMDIIETGDPDVFKQYLSETDNTICRRHPISVFLHMLRNCSTNIKVKFLRYEQSSHCKTLRDSSVSYASAVAKNLNSRPPLVESGVGCLNLNR
ncbi:hypothetical protein LguiA_036523 [Lonicera macranthoides]